LAFRYCLHLAAEDHSHLQGGESTNHIAATLPEGLVGNKYTAS
jgi:hypothetical protein